MKNLLLTILFTFAVVSCTEKVQPTEVDVIEVDQVDTIDTVTVDEVSDVDVVETTGSEAIIEE